MPEIDGFETVWIINVMLNVHKVKDNRKISLPNTYFAEDKRSNINTNNETFELEYLLKSFIIINSGKLVIRLFKTVWIQGLIFYGEAYEY